MSSLKDFYLIPRALLDLCSCDQEIRLDRVPTNPSWRIIGMGGSYNAGLAVAPALVRIGLPARAQLASELLTSEFAGWSLDEGVVLVSNSGESLETVSVARELKERGHRTVLALTNTNPSSLTRLVPEYGLLRVDDATDVGMVAFGATCLALYKLACRLRGAEPIDRSALESAASASLRCGLALCPRWSPPPANVDVVGRGALLGAAAQAALIIREIARVPASAWETSNYRHGPIESIGDDDLVIVLGHEDGQTARLDRGAARQLRAISDRVVTVGWPDSDVPFTCSEELRAIISVLPAACLAYAWAEEKGHNPGDFRYTTRTIVDNA